MPAPTHSIRRKIRVHKKDSAYVYMILEACEGIASYSTLDHKTGDSYRDLDLQIPPDFAGEVQELLKQLGDLVYEMPIAESKEGNTAHGSQS